MKGEPKKTVDQGMVMRRSRKSTVTRLVLRTAAVDDSGLMLDSWEGLLEGLTSSTLAVFGRLVGRTHTPWAAGTAPSKFRGRAESV